MSKYLFYILLKLFILTPHIYQTQAYRTVNDSGVDTILAAENESVKIQCDTATANVAHCGVRHRSIRYSTVKSSFNTKIQRCYVEVNATKTETGDWYCYISTNTVGVEVLKTIRLRIVGELAAIQTVVKTTAGSNVTLHCITTRGFIPLNYCRFEPPNKPPFSIDATVTKNNPLLERYYFPENKSLDRGDCAVTINHITLNDVGKWTCGAGLEGGREHFDDINMNVNVLPYELGPGPLFAIILVTITIIMAFLALGVWIRQQCQRRVLVPDQAQELQPMATSPVSKEVAPAKNIPLVVVHPSSDSESGSSILPVSPTQEQQQQ